MPSVRIAGPYRFYFYSADGSEPPHIHVERDKHVAKYWLNPVTVINRDRFSQQELNRIERIIGDNLGVLQTAWEDFFSED